VLLLVAIVGVPLGYLFATALEYGPAGVVTTLSTGATGQAVLNTLWTSLAVTVLAVISGTAAAVITERSQAPGRGWLRSAVLATLLAAPLVSALGWARAYGPAGLLEHAAGISWSSLFGPVGIVVVGAAGAVPIAYLVVSAGLATRAEADVERAARAAGADARTANRTNTLPLLAPISGAATALVFVSAVNAFEVPVVLGLPAGFTTMTTRLYQDLTLSADPAAFTSAVVLASALVVLALAVLGPADALTSVDRARRTAATGGLSAPTGRRSWGLAATLWCFLVLTALVPLIALMLVALTRGVGLEPVPANWTLDNFATALDEHTAAALTTSVLLAATAATVVVLLGGLTAALARRPGGRALGTVVTLTFAVAGSALAVAVLLAYGRVLRDTLAIILVAYLAKFWVLGHRPLSGSADRLPVDLIRAARASGAGPLDTVRTVVIPILRPALAAGWLLVFVFAVHELTISSLLYGPGTETLAVLVLNRQELGDVGATSALSVILTAIIGAAALLLLVARRAAARLAAGR